MCLPGSCLQQNWAMQEGRGVDGRGRLHLWNGGGRDGPGQGRAGLASVVMGASSRKGQHCAHWQLFFYPPVEK